MRHIEVFETGIDASRALAERLADEVATLVAQQASTHVVLTGGTSGIAALEQLAEVSIARSIDWSSVHFWFGDERWVPSDDADRNAVQARNAFLTRAGIAEAAIHEMGASDSGTTLDEAAGRYSDELRRWSPPGQGTPRFDILLLGVGPDGHIASLFPGRNQVNERLHTVVSVRNSPKPPPERISLTLPAINAANRVWFAAQGVNKQAAVRLALANMTPYEVPAAGAHGRTETLWFLDQDAAIGLHVDQLNNGDDE